MPLKQLLMVLVLLRQLLTKLKRNQLLMLQQQLRKKLKKNWQPLRQLIKEKATAISAKEGQLTADQNAANQAKAAYETAQTVANERQLLLQPLKQLRKKQNLQQLQQLMFVKNSQCHKSMSMLLRFMSLKQ